MNVSGYEEQQADFRRILVESDLSEEAIHAILERQDCHIFENTYVIAAAVLQDGDRAAQERFLELSGEWARERMGSGQIMMFQHADGGLAFVGNGIVHWEEYIQSLQQNGLFGIRVGVSTAGNQLSAIPARYVEARRSVKICRLLPRDCVFQYSDEISYDDSDKIIRALQYLNANYQNDVDMATVSNHVSLNYNYFSGMFKNRIDMNFVDYLALLRIEKAKLQLRQNTDSIQKISENVGYADPKRFAKVFRKIEGVSPAEYRKQMG